jgi:YbbR domain-containing protein
LKKSNILIGILSLVIAVILWGYVAYDVNPERVITVPGIPVRFINDRELGNRELMLVGGMDETIDVRFTGRLQNLVRVNKETVRAVVDLRQITTAGETMAEFVLEIDGSPYLTDAQPNRLTVTITTDRIVSKYVDLSLDFVGEVAENYMRDPAIFDPASIRIVGPAGEIESVNAAVVRYEPPEPLSRSVSDRPTDYALYTENGMRIESEFITDNLVVPIRMTIPVVMVKPVRLVVDFIEGGGLRGENISWRVEPESVIIAGDPSEIRDMWTLQVEQIDLSKLQGDTNLTVPIWYPDGVRNLDLTDEAQLFITIEGVSVRDVSTTNVATKGLELPDGYHFSLVNPLNVTLRGPEVDLERVTPNNVRVVADFTGVDIMPGRISRPVSVFVDGFETVGAIDFGYTIIAEFVYDGP